MFFDLVRRNSRRSRKENGLFFLSLLVSIVAFYIILSLSNQDVILFLRQMESDAVNHLLYMIPVFYGATLVILFFLVYFASKYQLERRSHEFGVYLMLGMRRSKLNLLLLAEDFVSSVLSLLIGIPIAVLLSEFISLVTVRLVGIGILGHQVTFSLQAVGWTVLGFLLIKLMAFVILSGRISCMELDKLLTPAPDGAKKQYSKRRYRMALIMGGLCLFVAYGLGISGAAWISIANMGLTLLTGMIGTFLLFFGLQRVLGRVAKQGAQKNGLSVFTFRQLQENIIYKYTSLAVSSLLILAALCCFGYGLALALHYGASSGHVLDYSFQGGDNVTEELQEAGVIQDFEQLFELRTSFGTEIDWNVDEIINCFSQQEDSDSKEFWISAFEYDGLYLISLSGYNQLLHLTGEEPIVLEERQAVIYSYNSFINSSRVSWINKILSQNPLTLQINREDYELNSGVYSTNIVTDRLLTFYLALIVPDEDFDRLTGGQGTSYLNAVLDKDLVQENGLMQAIMQVNKKLDKTEIPYESYLQNMGRQLFYVVSSSYVTLYLAVIFLVIANTVLGVQFLMQQQKTGRRYHTLVRLGSSYETICDSAKQQIHWFFGLPMAVAVISSIFGVYTLVAGILPSSLQEEKTILLWIAVALIFLLIVVEWLYQFLVIKTSNRYILTLMEPEREE